MSLTSKRPKPSTTVHPVWTGPDSAKKRRPAATKPQAGLTTQHHTTHKSTTYGRCSQIFVSSFFSRSLVKISIVTLSANPSRKDLPPCAQSAFPPQGTRPPFHPYAAPFCPVLASEEASATTSLVDISDLCVASTPIPGIEPPLNTLQAWGFFVVALLPWRVSSCLRCSLT